MPAARRLTRVGVVAASLVASVAFADEPQVGPSPFPVQIAFDGAAVPYPPYSLVRWDEDYDYLRDPTKRRDALDALKRVPFGSDAFYFSLGGDARERFELYRGVNGPPPGVDQDGYFLQRYFAHADVHLGKHVRVFGQLASAWVQGDDPQTVVPFQKQPLDANQLFVDVKTSVGATIWTARFGRQELLLGAGRLVAPREGPNVRRPFDGGSLLTNIGALSVHAFYLRPTALKADPGAFDLASSKRDVLYGAYATFAFGNRTAPRLDAYLLVHHDQGTRVLNQTGAGERRVYGVRSYASSSGWQYDVEADAAEGEALGRPLTAWAVSAVIGHLFARKSRLPVGVGLGFDAASGARHSGGRLTQWDPLFPRAQYFTEAAFFGPGNLTVLHPGIDIHATTSISVTGEALFVWRTERGDGAYSPGNAPVMRPVPDGGRWLGVQADVGATWQASRHFRVVAHYAHLFASLSAERGGLGSADFGLLEGFASF